MGGTAYIDFQDYYLASVLTQMREWFLSSPSTLREKWKLPLFQVAI